MARQFKFEVERNGGTTSELYVHDDDTLELTEADTGKAAEYLIDKLVILREMYKWARKHNVHKVEFKEEGY